VTADWDTALVRPPGPHLAEGIVTVDIGEFGKLEGCVTCLSVLAPGR
jgi:hypothetical protein